MLWLRKSKKGFTLIELMVVVAIIGVLALLGLRMYSGQQDKAKNAIVKANAGTVQTLIQAELADETPATVWGSAGAGISIIINESGIYNPFGTTPNGDDTNVDGKQIANPANRADAEKGEVFVTFELSTLAFSINGIDADLGDVYTPSLTAQ